LQFPHRYAAMNNTALHAATGKVIVLLNNDVDVIDPGWLEEMVSHAMRPDVGLVGAKLLYDDSVQHAGIVLGAWVGNMESLPTVSSGTCVFTLAKPTFHRFERSNLTALC
jgi:hypothetical protein